MTGIVLIVCVAALTWGTLLAFRGPLQPGCAVYLIAACCFGVEFLHVDAAGLTWSLDRLYLICLVIAYLIQSRLGRTAAPPPGPGEWVLAGFVTILLLSTFTHDWRTRGADEVPVLMHLVNGYLIPVAVFWIARNSLATERNVWLTYLVLVGFGIYLSVTALLEATGQWSLVFPRYIADSKVGIHFGRARGPMVQSARLGTYLVICLAATWIAWGYLARWGRAGQLLAAALVPLYGIAIFCTLTRSVWMGAALAGLVILGCTLHVRWRPVLLLGSCALLLTLVLIAGNRLVSIRRDTSAAESRQSAYMRASFAYVSWQMFKDRPILGFGFGQFPRANRPYLQDRNTALNLESIRGYVHHNSFLSVLVELGLFGLIFFVALLAYWFWTGWQLYRARGVPDWVRAHGLLAMASFAPYMVQLMFHDVSFSPVESSLVFLLAGVATGLKAAYCPSDSAIRGVEPRRWETRQFRPA